MRILFYGEKWETFDCQLCDRSTIRKRFVVWSNNNIFYDAYIEMYRSYTFNITFKRLFIDSTIIQNKNCSDENVTFGGHKLKGKKQSKISIISDSNGCILSYINSNPKPFDNQFIKPLISKLNVNLKKGATVIGDKGYINKQKRFKNNKIKLLAVKRKNQKPNNAKDKKILKDRYKVEQTFSHLKRSYKRIDTIEDKKLQNYETFLMMAVTCQFIKQLY